MNVLDAIFTRRSVRNFTGEELKEDEIKQLLRAGFDAPTAHHKQPVEFIVLRDKDVIGKVLEKHKYAQMLKESGFAILVCGDSEKEESHGFLVENCSAAMQNILLAGHGLGLGGVWVSVHGNDEVEKGFRDIFELPSHILPVGLAVLGNTEKEGWEVDRYDETRVHTDTWSKK